VLLGRLVVGLGDQTLVQHLLVLAELRDRVLALASALRRLLRLTLRRLLLGACCWGWPCGGCCWGACWLPCPHGWTGLTRPPAEPAPMPNMARPAPPPSSPADCTPRAT